jgi:hypothetical protein
MRHFRFVKLIPLGLLLTLSPALTVASATPQSSAEQTVYVTKTGKKYHAAGCRYLRRSQYSMKLKDAVNAGYTPCSVCAPPTLHESSSAGARSQSQPNNSSEQNLKRAGTPSGETTATGKPIYVGPHGGRYHYSKSGKKVYERRKR